MEQIQVFHKSLAKLEILVFFGAVCFMKRRIRQILQRKRQPKDKVKEGVVLSKGILSSLIKYVGSYNRCIFPLSIFFIIISGLMLVFWDVWLGWWSTNFLKLAKKDYYLFALYGLSAIIALYILFRVNFILRKLRRVGHNLFMSTLNKVVHSELGWFQYFTAELIIYRMTTDQAILDNDIGKNTQIVAFACIMTVISILILNVVYPGLFLVGTFFIVICLVNYISRYQRSARIFMAEWFKRRLVWYNSYVLAFRNLMGLR